MAFAAGFDRRQLGLDAIGEMLQITRGRAFGGSFGEDPLELTGQLLVFQLPDRLVDDRRMLEPEPARFPQLSVHGSRSGERATDEHPSWWPNPAARWP